MLFDSNHFGTEWHPSWAVVNMTFIKVSYTYHCFIALTFSYLITRITAAPVKPLSPTVLSLKWFYHKQIHSLFPNYLKTPPVRVSPMIKHFQYNRNDERICSHVLIYLTESTTVHHMQRWFRFLCRTCVEAAAGEPQLAALSLLLY